MTLDVLLTSFPTTNTDLILALKSTICNSCVNMNNTLKKIFPEKKQDLTFISKANAV